ncbi:hypothetical protein [Shimia marina]|uniref:Uncharacterized protein n=1 Tax=Shimia marina TaxID=321267 RepID=A0A0N7LS77_9RHOB|nr:hypothetical protein [Shimia marina]CUH52852.1 hypothetical protein SHM7688_02299 [Shimia marina]SFD88896.1 hypothetical protein SAMN04488037_103103 [Shimia marina]
MDKKYYDELPLQIEARAERYLELAHTLAEKKFSVPTVREIPLLSVQLAAAMMNLEAAEIMASEQERIAAKLEEA